jgi:hypothetical protein
MYIHIDIYIYMYIYIYRFLPLIIDEEHAERALPLLQEELLRLDRY